MVVTWVSLFIYMVAMSYSTEFSVPGSHMGAQRTPDDERCTAAEEENSPRKDFAYIGCVRQQILLASRTPSRKSLAYLMVVSGMTLGIGQAIGISYWTIAAMYAGGKPAQIGMMRIAGTYLLTRMIGSVAAGMFWDGESGAPLSQIIIQGLGFIKCSRNRHTISSLPSTAMIRHGILRPIVATMLLSQVVFVVGPTEGWQSDITVLSGFALCGLATGAMNSLVPILAAHHYGVSGFRKHYSYFMLATVIFQLIFYNGLESIVYWGNYGKRDPETVMVFTDDIEFSDYDNWGGCNMRSSCYRISFWVQAAALVVPLFLCHRLVIEEQACQNGDVIIPNSLDVSQGLKEYAVPSTNEDSHEEIGEGVFEHTPLLRCSKVI